MDEENSLNPFYLDLYLNRKVKNKEVRQMKKLIIIATLGLAFSFPSLSFAFDHMDLYTKPITKSEVNDEIKGGSVEKDFTSFYTSTKSVNTVASPLIWSHRSDDEYISVFGVQIPRTPRV